MALQSNAELRLLYGLLPVIFVFDRSVQFVILPYYYYMFVHNSTSCFFVLIRLPWGLLLNTWLTFLLLSILLTWPIQFNRLTLTNESVSKSPNGCTNSSLYCFLQFSFTLIPQNILPKTWFQNQPAVWPYLYSGSKILLRMLSLVLLISNRFLFLAFGVPIVSLIEEEMHNIVCLNVQFFFFNIWS